MLDSNQRIEYLSVDAFTALRFVAIPSATLVLILHLVEPLGIEFSSGALQAPAMTTSAKVPLNLMEVYFLSNTGHAMTCVLFFVV